MVKNQIKPFLIAAAIACVIGFAIPSSWIMRVDKLSFVSADTVVQDRTLLVPMWARWTASVERLTDNGVKIECSGSGDWYYENLGSTVRPMTLKNWVGELCALEKGKLYRLVALWQPRFAIWKWRVEAVSEPYRVPE